MKTRIVMHHSSESPYRVKEIIRRLKEIGFASCIGDYDYVYDWGRNDVTPDDVLNLVDYVTRKLRGTHCWFHFTTTND